MPIGTTFTRGQLRERLRSEIRYQGAAGATTDDALNFNLQLALSRVFEILSRTDQGILTTTLEVTIATGDPDGQVPGERVPLPADFRRVSSLLVNRYEAYRSNPSELHRLRNSRISQVGSLRRKYTLSGPGQTTLEVSLPTQLEIYPGWVEGDVYSLLYVTQPPTLGDPADVLDDALIVDLLMEPVVRAVIARAGIRSLSRTDVQGQQRMAKEATEAEAEFDDARAVRGGDVRTLASYDSGSGGNRGGW